jgi:serine/threonine protein kinase
MKVSIYNVKDTPIGCGGMVEVYFGRDSNGNAVAIKKMRAELTVDANLRTFFHREVNALKQLEHQSIVKMYGSFEENGNLYLVMEYVEGETIEQYVKQNGTITESNAIRLLTEILPAIGYLHQRGFVHRDIKPSNIMFRPDGKICLLDFGIVKDMNHSSGHTINQIIGTDGYMSVEQAEGMSIDHRSDIYSLGCVLYYMLIGNHAIQKQSDNYATRMTIIKSTFPRAKDVNPNLSNNIQRILDKATDKNMLHRFQSCREFELELNGGATAVTENYTNMISVGREDCDIIISHPKVSRRHLDIIKEPASEGDFYRLCDRSSNGTVMNGEKFQNREKTWLNHWRYTNTPNILLAGEVELKWPDVEAAFAKKQGDTNPPEKDSPPTPAPTSPPKVMGENAAGWLVAIYIFVALGGWLGVIFGIFVYRQKINLPDERKAYKYKESHRTAALIGAILSGISMIFWTIVINS